jgi:hypothetical protein
MKRIILTPEGWSAASFLLGMPSGAFSSACLGDEVR